MFLQSKRLGSGLGSSSTIMVAVISAVAEWLELNMTSHETANLAYVLEREDIGLKGGKQDHYAAVFGGFNLMRFRSEGVDVNRIKIKDDTINELQYRSVLSIPAPRIRGHKDSQVKSFNKGSNEETLDREADRG